MMRSSRRFGPRSNGYVQLHSPRCHPAVPPEDDRSTGPPEGVVLDLVRAQTSTACVAIASGCAGTGRGRPARLAKSAEVGRRPCGSIGRARKGLCCLGRRLLASNRILQ